MAPLNTSWDPTQRMMTTLVKTMKMITAVSTARARVELQAAS
jgi:hypothetical protein